MGTIHDPIEKTLEGHPVHRSVHDSNPDQVEEDPEPLMLERTGIEGVEVDREGVELPQEIAQERDSQDVAVEAEGRGVDDGRPE